MNAHRPAGIPVPLLVLVIAVALVVLWPRLAPPPPALPDERPVAVPTSSPSPAPTARSRAPLRPRDLAARAAQAPPGPHLEPLAPDRRPRGRARRRMRASGRGHRRTPSHPRASPVHVAAHAPPASRSVLRHPRRRDAELLP